MKEQTEVIGFQVQLETDFESALERVAAVLKDEGFGILTEIDVKATLKEKIDVDFRPYRILGACNPPLAYKALNTAPQVGLLLPCNVTVDQVSENNIEVNFLNPMLMADVVREPGLQPVAQEVKEKFQRAATALNEET